MKFFTKEIKIALTAIIAVVLLYLLINFMKGINIFKSTNSYNVEFANIQGLAVSNAVYANGYPVGIVRDIKYDYSRSDRVIVSVELDKEMQVPEGTHAELETSLMGGVSMHLILGPNPTKILPRGSTIKGCVHLGAMAQAEEIVPTIVAMAPKLDSIVSNLNALSGDPSLRIALTNFAAMSVNLRETSVQLNAMLNDQVPVMLGNLQKVSADLNKLSGNLANVDVAATMKSVDESLTQVKGFSANLNKISTDLNSKLNSKDNSLGLLMNDRGLYDNLNNTITNLNHTIQSGDSLMTDLKAHPKRYVHFSVFGKKDK